MVMQDTSTHADANANAETVTIPITHHYYAYVHRRLYVYCCRYYYAMILNTYWH